MKLQVSASPAGAGFKSEINVKFYYQKSLDEFFKAAEAKEEMKRTDFSEMKVQQLG